MKIYSIRLCCDRVEWWSRQWKAFCFSPVTITHEKTAAALANRSSRHFRYRQAEFLRIICSSCSKPLKIYSEITGMLILMNNCYISCKYQYSASSVLRKNNKFSSLKNNAFVLQINRNWKCLWTWSKPKLDQNLVHS